MNISIKATNIELTDAIRMYLENKISTLEKFIPENSYVYVEIGKTTNHHKQGEIFKAEVDIKGDKGRFFAMKEDVDLYAAIDGVREDLVRKISYHKDKKQTLFKRGAASVKKLLKGIKSYNR